jgi:hypothetical protein
VSNGGSIFVREETWPRTLTQCDSSVKSCAGNIDKSNSDNGMQHYVTSSDNRSIVGAINRSSDLELCSAVLYKQWVATHLWFVARNSLGHDL